MIQLEKLYNCAEKNLVTSKTIEWQNFANEFKDIFDSDMLIYRPHWNNSEPKKCTDIDIITTSDWPKVERYIANKIHHMHEYPETSMKPLEPARRTDAFSNQEFKKFGPVADYLISENIFYFMAVPAFMSDGSIVGLYVWRSEADGDFSDMEKQRLTLVMRYILAIVDHAELLVAAPNEDVKKFSKKHGLTETESEILSGLIQGLSPRQISEQTDRTYGTVRWHVQNILEKCQVKTRQSLLSEFYNLIKR